MDGGEDPNDKMREMRPKKFGNHLNENDENAAEEQQPVPPQQDAYHVPVAAEQANLLQQESLIPVNLGVSVAREINQKWGGSGEAGNPETCQSKDPQKGPDQSRSLLNQPGCSFWSSASPKKKSIVVHGSSSDENSVALPKNAKCDALPKNAKCDGVKTSNKFFQPFGKQNCSSDEDDDPPALRQKSKIKILDDSDSTDYEDLPSTTFHKFPIGKETKEGQKKVSEKQYFLRPPKQTTGASSTSDDADDPTQKTLQASRKGKRTSRDQMLEALASFFANKKGSKKCRQMPSSSDDGDVPEGDKRKTPTKQAEAVEDPYRGLCAVCLENVPNCILRCKHLYCEGCCKKLKKMKKPCPKCKKRFRTWDTSYP